MFKAQASIGAALALLLTASASADMVTFWKTTVCPDFGGLKPALAREVGTMEAPVSVDATKVSVGGPYCNLFVTPDTFSPGQKQKSVTNANIEPQPSPGLGFAWDCVVCQYHNKVIIWGAAMPAVSISALAFLGGGLAMFGLARLRRRQAQTTR